MVKGHFSSKRTYKVDCFPLFLELFRKSNRTSQRLSFPKLSGPTIKHILAISEFTSAKDYPKAPVAKVSFKLINLIAIHGRARSLSLTQ